MPAKIFYFLIFQITFFEYKIGARERAKANDRVLQDVILIEPTNPKATVSFNLLEQTKCVFPEEQVKELVGVFRKIWLNAWDHRMRHIFTLPKSSFNLRDLIDNKKILLVKLEK